MHGKHLTKNNLPWSIIAILKIDYDKQKLKKKVFSHKMQQNYNNKKIKSYIYAWECEFFI